MDVVCFLFEFSKRSKFVLEKFFCGLNFWSLFALVICTIIWASTYCRSFKFPYFCWQIVYCLWETIAKFFHLFQSLRVKFTLELLFFVKIDEHVHRIKGWPWVFVPSEKLLFGQIKLCYDKNCRLFSNLKLSKRMLPEQKQLSNRVTLTLIQHCSNDKYKSLVTQSHHATTALRQITKCTTSNHIKWVMESERLSSPEYEFQLVPF